jgi:hypothetical protein
MNPTDWIHLIDWNKNLNEIDMRFECHNNITRTTLVRTRHHKQGHTIRPSHQVKQGNRNSRKNRTTRMAYQAGRLHQDNIRNINNSNNDRNTTKTTQTKQVK